MFPQRLVALDRLYDQVQDTAARTNVRLQQAYEFFAIIRIYPRTILQAIEAESCQSATECIAQPVPILWNIEHNHPPPAIPPSRLLRSSLMPLQFSAASFSYLDVRPPRNSYESDHALFCKSAGNGLKAVREFALAPRNAAEQLNDVRCRGGQYDQARDCHCRKQRALHVSPPASCTRLIFLRTHRGNHTSPHLRGRADMGIGSGCGRREVMRGVGGGARSGRRCIGRKEVGGIGGCICRCCASGKGGNVNPHVASGWKGPMRSRACLSSLAACASRIVRNSGLRQSYVFVLLLMLRIGEGWQCKPTRRLATLAASGRASPPESQPGHRPARFGARLRRFCIAASGPKLRFG